jgi:hypothetical protein
LILAAFPAIFSRRTLMMGSSQLGDQMAARPAAPQAPGRLGQAWGRVKRAVTRSVFWAYERGTWQYDLIVLAILAFIFLSPRSWFQDRPTLQLTDLRHRQGFVELGHGQDGWRYLVDARLVEAQASQGPDDALREILRLRLKRPFTVKSVDPIYGRDNVILGYTVVVVFQ